MTKRINNLVLMGLILCGTGISCSEDFIDLPPKSRATVENFYNKPNDFESALVACYDVLQSDELYGLAFDRMLGLRADDAVDDDFSGSTRASDIDKFTAGPSNTFVEDAWKGTYIGISRCNLVIDKIADIQMNETSKNRILAEAKFIRALIYFNAVRIWGDIPLIKNYRTVQETQKLIKEKKLIRNKVSEVYDFIIEDLTFAEKYLPGSNLKGRATSLAAETLLGKVYLTLKKWPEAVAVLRKNVDKITLLPDIADVFNVNNKDNAEIIFAISYDKSIEGEGHEPWFNNANFRIIPQSLLDSYNPNDARLLLVKTVETPGIGLLPRKFYDTKEHNQVGNNFPGLRGPDHLLMLSEALNEIGYVSSGDAFKYLNRVRTRAGLAAYTSSDLPNQSSFRDAVLLERKFEFALEFDRWFDLVRTGKAKEEMAKVGITLKLPKDLLFPIPQSEIQIINNPKAFSQNKGY